MSAPAVHLDDSTSPEALLAALLHRVPVEGDAVGFAVTHLQTVSGLLSALADELGGRGNTAHLASAALSLTDQVIAVLHASR